MRGATVEPREPASGPFARQGHRALLLRLEASLEGPMFLLAIAWIWLFFDELLGQPSSWERTAAGLIWTCFILEFLVKLYLAPRKLAYVASNWITAVALLIPAVRMLRMLRILRVFQTARAVSMFRVVRGLMSGRRLYSELRQVQGPEPEPGMNVGILVALSPGTGPGPYCRLAEQMAEDIRPEIEHATRLAWDFDVTEPESLESDGLRQPADFLDEASFRMAEGPYDLALVVTNVGLASRRQTVVAGLASSTARVAVISTRKLTTAPRGEPARQLEDGDVRWNAGALLMRLLGQIGGLGRTAEGSDVMGPFAFRPGRSTLPRFNARERRHLARAGTELPERELRGGNALVTLLFHIVMAVRHPREVLGPLLRNRAILLPLSLPKLATAAVAPSFVLVFSAEIWDVGLGIGNAVAGLYAATSILAASFYLAWAQALFLPRREKRIVTEHLAVANVVIYLSILLACVGLFLIVGALMLAIVVLLFPADLMQTWPTLDHPVVGLAEKLRLAAFIATIGVTTGALAGGFESRSVIRHLALFEE